MSENLKKLLEEASKNEELKAKLAALTDKDTAVEKAIEIAKEYGITLTAEDFQPAGGAELSRDELDAVAGGSTCLAIGGGSCPCVVAGGGSSGPCILMGSGSSEPDAAAEGSVCIVVGGDAPCVIVGGGNGSGCVIVGGAT